MMIQEMAYEKKLRQILKFQLFFVYSIQFGTIFDNMPLNFKNYDNDIR